jgi:hypothetical protein
MRLVVANKRLCFYEQWNNEQLCLPVVSCILANVFDTSTNIDTSSDMKGINNIAI